MESDEEHYVRLTYDQVVQLHHLCFVDYLTKYFRDSDRERKAAFDLIAVFDDVLNETSERD